MRVKYGFTDEEPRRRVVTLMADIMNELARTKEPTGDGSMERLRSESFPASGDMDEALFEVAHLVADLTRVDGTVVMTDRLEILGFGVEIAGELPEVRQVARRTTSKARNENGFESIVSAHAIAPLIGYARPCVALTAFSPASPFRSHSHSMRRLRTASRSRPRRPRAGRRPIPNGGSPRAGRG